MSFYQLLFLFGLRKSPPVDELLKLASNPSNHTLRASALEYLLSHFQELYAGAYPATDARKLAFVPSIRAADGSSFLSSPLDVYTNPEVAVLGFPVVASAYRAEALAKLRVASDPSSGALVEALLATPPKDIEYARKVFEVS